MIAAAGLAIVYLSLAYVGASSVEAIGMKENGGAILTAVATTLFGSFGTIILGLAITFACLTTAIGLTSACARFFTQLVPSMSYKTFVVILMLFSAVISNVGLTQLISISIPILTFVYPIAITLIALSLIERAISFGREVYVTAVIISSILSIFDGLKAAGIILTSIDNFFKNYLPLYSQGLGWLIPTVAAAFIGYIISIARGTHHTDSIQRKAS